MLADTAIRNAKPRELPYKLGDSRGLYPLVTPSGGKWWAFDYRFQAQGPFHGHLTPTWRSRKPGAGGTAPASTWPMAATPRRARPRGRSARGAGDRDGNPLRRNDRPQGHGRPATRDRRLPGRSADPLRLTGWRRLRSFDPASCAMRNGASSIWTRPIGISPHENPRASPGAVVTPGSRVPAGAVSPDRTVAVCLPRRAVGGAAPAWPSGGT